MFFLNLTAGEFFALLGTLGGLITALYLLDRTKRKRVVSSLRFWTAAVSAEDQQRRKRMREPWSLALQLISLLGLLLAIAQTQWGTRERRGRDHVLLLDTSSWTAQHLGQGTLLDREKAIARQYLATLPARDRVMLLRVEGLAIPVTSFTADRASVLAQLDGSVPGFSALNINQALMLASEAQSWSGGQQGEIVYVGPRLIAESDGLQPKLSNLRTVTVGADRENCGIRHIGVKRSEEDADSWQATVTVRNYGATRRMVRLKAKFAGTSFAPRALVLGPGEETGAEYSFKTETAGQLVAELQSGDSLPTDDQARLQLPKAGRLRVAVFTSRPEVLRPLLEANHRLSVEFFALSAYDPEPAADVIVLDQFAPREKPRLASLWIAPPQDGTPLPVKSKVSDAIIKTWHSETALGTGLHAKETRLPEAEVFQTFEGDVPVASVEEGPIVVARSSTPDGRRVAVIGFDPLAGRFRFEVTAPLLFANLVRWLSPEAFRALDITAGRVGAATVMLDPNERAGRLNVNDDGGLAVPFTVREQTVQLFASHPGIIHVVSDDRERVLSLTLPDVAQFEWKPPAGAAEGLPMKPQVSASAIDLWQWFALLGATGFFIEWMLFGRHRTIRRVKVGSARSPARVREQQKELVAK
jgi:hypothetical protein